MLGTRKAVPVLLVLFLCNLLSLAAPGQRMNASSVDGLNSRVVAPLDLAILIQDDLVSHVGNELKVSREFIRSLPRGSRVMVGYITAGTLQVRRTFTDDLGAAAASLRIPLSSSSASPFNPYVEVLEGLRRFDSVSKNPKALLLISDGLDVSRGFHPATILKSIDLERAIQEAKRRDVAIYSFYAPSVGLTGRNRLASSLGQSSLKRISDETGGEAFFQGSTDFVTFDAYFEALVEAINRRYAEVEPAD